MKIVNFLFLLGNNKVKMCRIKLPYGEVIDKNRETAKLDLPRNYRATEYFQFLPYLNDAEKPNFETFINNVINNTTIDKTFEIIYLQLEI